MELRLKADTKLSVMIVEDEPEIRATTRAFVEAMEIFTLIIEAENGSEAFIKFQNQSFDLIITDINMPGKDGLELIENVTKSQSAQTKTPIILLSANINSDNAKIAREFGVKYALTKPCSIEDFIAKVTKVLAKEKSNKFYVE